MYRTINTETWSDPWFETLIPHERLLFLYLITTSKQTSCGAFQISIRTLGYETGLEEKIVPTLNGLLDKGEGRVVWWKEHNIIWVRNFYRYQRAKTSDSFRISAIKVLVDFPEEVQDRVVSVYPELAQPSYISDLPDTTLPPPSHQGGSTLPTTGTEQEQSQEQSSTMRAPRKTLASHPIPPDFAITPVMRQWAKDKHITEWIDIDRHTERFIAYWTEGEGQGKCKKNWRLAWENWMIDEAERAEARGMRRANGSNISQIGNGKPPEGYSWEKDEGGHWIHLGGDKDGRLPYDALTDAEVTERHKERTRLEGQNRRVAG